MKDLRALALIMKDTRLKDSLRSISVKSDQTSGNQGKKHNVSHEKREIRALMNECGFGNVNVVEQSESF